ncbi:MAG: O-antigen ligase family protein [Chloroflexi bacterium]|nr:O-antigen ligase family protein [Chloroflexota bacterium]
MSIKSSLRIPTWAQPDRSRQYPWLRPAIIAAVCLLSLALAVVNSPTLDLLLGAGVAGVVVVLAFLRWPSLGVAALVVACLVAPSPQGNQGTSGAIHSGILMTVLLTGLWILDMLTRQKRLYLQPSSTNVSMLVFMGVAVIGLVNGQVNYYALARLASPFAQISGLAVFILSAAAFLLAANQIKTQAWLERITWLFIALGSVYVVGRLNYPLERLIRPLFQYGSDASMFWTWLVSLTAAQFLINHKLGTRWRVLLGIVLGFTLYISMVTASYWKSGWMPALVSLGVIVFLGLPRLRPAVILAGLVIGVWWLLGEIQVLPADEDYSIITRLEAWRLILEIVKANPVLGLGMSNYYWYTPLFPIMGYAVNYNSHNNYIDILAQTGIVGLAVFAWVSIAIGRLGWRLKDAAPDGFARAYAIGALGGLAGTLLSGMFGDWVLPFVYNVGLHGMRSSLLGWLFLGGLVLLERLYLAPREGESGEV